MSGVIHESNYRSRELTQRETGVKAVGCKLTKTLLPR